VLLRDPGRRQNGKIEVIDNLVVFVAAQVNDEFTAFIICIDGMEIEEIQITVDSCECTCLTVKIWNLLVAFLSHLKHSSKRFIAYSTNNKLRERKIQWYFNRHKIAVSVREAVEVVGTPTSCNFV
jgi:hypothetical protein